MKKDDKVFDPVEEYVAGLTQRPVTSFHPSSASCVIGKKIVGACLRQQYWKWKHEPMDGDMSYRTWMAARLGSAYEKAFLEAYRAKGLLRAQNYPFRIWVMGLQISGRLDGLTKKGEVIECKSAYGKAFYFQISRKPKPEHLCQIMVYLAVLGLDTCILPYGSRDDTAKRQGYVLRKKDIEAEGIQFIKIIDRWKALQTHLETCIIPSRDYLPTDWHCNYCGYRKKCYRTPKGLDLFKTAP